MGTYSSAQIEQVNAAIDVVDYAKLHSGMRKIAAKEWAGPCPKCGGVDRFHANSEGWWFCRSCHEKRGDGIGLVMFVEGLGFPAVCERYLAGDVPAVASISPRQPEPKLEPWRDPEWQREAWAIIDKSISTLESDAGAQGREYLLGRSIQPTTWTAWRIGYDCLSQAVVIPWIVGDTVTTVQYRRIREADKRKRFFRKKGSGPIVYGAHLLDFSKRDLVIVEGELNAVSIWQAAQDLRVNVVSIGSQSVSDDTKRAIRKLAAKFARVIVWCDNAANAQDVLQAVGPHADGMKSPRGLDANDLLQRGLLRAFMEAVLRGANLDSDYTVERNCELFREAIRVLPDGEWMPSDLCRFDSAMPSAQLARIGRGLEQFIAAHSAQYRGGHHARVLGGRNG